MRLKDLFSKEIPRPVAQTPVVQNRHETKKSDKTKNDCVTTKIYDVKIDENEKQMFIFKVICWQYEADYSGTTQWWKDNYNPMYGGHKQISHTVESAWCKPDEIDAIMSDLMVHEHRCAVSVADSKGNNIKTNFNYDLTR